MHGLPGGLANLLEMQAYRGGFSASLLKMPTVMQDAQAPDACAASGDNVAQPGFIPPSLDQRTGAADSLEPDRERQPTS